MIVNRQRRVGVDLAALRDYVTRLRRELGLSRRDFNVSLTEDREIARLNAAFRGKPHPTDVLSFPWSEETGAGRHHRKMQAMQRHAAQTPPLRFRREFAGFLGDIVISAEIARRNARAARSSTAREIRRLILHGVLHLMGYDHERDGGEMAALEADLRGRLGL